jgi:hypothetical protein
LYAFLVVLLFCDFGVSGRRPAGCLAAVVGRLSTSAGWGKPFVAAFCLLLLVRLVSSRVVVVGYLSASAVPGQALFLVSTDAFVVWLICDLRL